MPNSKLSKVDFLFNFLNSSLEFQKNKRTRTWQILKLILSKGPNNLNRDRDLIPSSFQPKATELSLLRAKMDNRADQSKPGQQDK